MGKFRLTLTDVQHALIPVLDPRSGAQETCWLTQGQRSGKATQGSTRLVVVQTRGLRPVVAARSRSTKKVPIVRAMPRVTAVVPANWSPEVAM